MRTFLILIFGLLPYVAQAAEPPDTLIRCHYNDVSFPDFCRDMEQQYAIRIFFDDAWVKQVRVNLESDSITIAGAVETA